MVQPERKQYRRTQVGTTSGNDAEIIPLNYSHAFTPAVLAVNCNLHLSGQMMRNKKFETLDFYVKIFILTPLSFTVLRFEHTALACICVKLHRSIKYRIHRISIVGDITE